MRQGPYRKSRHAQQANPWFAKVREAVLDHQTLVVLLLLAVPNLIAWVVLFPGYFQADHQTGMALFLSNSPRQWHSLIWTFLAFPFMCLGPSYAIYGLVQIGLFVACAFFSIKRFARLGLIKSMVPTAALFGLFPSFILYNELYSSDICFAALLIALTAMLAEIVETEGDALRSCGFCVKVAILCFFVLSLRKNALLIGIILCIVIPLSYRRVWLRAVVALAGALAVSMAVDAALPVVIGAQPSPSQEMLAVPSLQIAATYATGGDIPQDADQYFTQQRSREEWAAAYMPYSADKAKDGVRLTPEFIKYWIELGIRNPRAYFLTYTQLEYPFWSLADMSENFTSVDFGCHEEFTLRFISQGHEEYLSQFTGEEGKSGMWLKTQKLQGIINNLRLPVLSDLYYLVLFNRGLPFWVLVFGIVVSRGHRRKEFFIVSIPVLSVVLSLLAFAPMPMMRYSMQTYYSLPLLIIYLCRRTAYWVRRPSRCR